MTCLHGFHINGSIMKGRQWKTADPICACQAASAGTNIELLGRLFANNMHQKNITKLTSCVVEATTLATSSSFGQSVLDQSLQDQCASNLHPLNNRI